jgi:hypothetical protein
MKAKGSSRILGYFASLRRRDINAHERTRIVSHAKRGACCSGGTHSDVGRDCRDAFVGLAKTCFKLGVEFWDYLGARLNVPGCQLIPPLPELILAKARSP